MKRKIVTTLSMVLLASGLYAGDVSTCNVCGGNHDNGKLTELVLVNELDSAAAITIFDADGNTLLDEYVSKGGKFSFHGVENKNAFGQEVYLCIAGEYSTTIQTGCSHAKIGEDVGDFIVKSYETTPCHDDGGDNGDGGEEPNAGNMSNLSLENMTGDSGTITVVDANGNTVFKDYVKEGDTFTIEGLDDVEHLGDYVIIKMHGKKIAQIPTGCASCEDLEDEYNGLTVVDSECTVSCHIAPNPQPEPNAGNMTSLTLQKWRNI